MPTFSQLPAQVDVVAIVGARVSLLIDTHIDLTDYLISTGVSTWPAKELTIVPVDMALGQFYVIDNGSVEVGNWQWWLNLTDTDGFMFAVLGGKYRILDLGNAGESVPGALNVDVNLGQTVLNVTIEITGTLNGGALAFNYVQENESQQWIVNHNLGTRPIVDLYTVGGLKMVAEVIHTTANQVVVNFLQPVAGIARCI